MEPEGGGSNQLITKVVTRCNVMGILRTHSVLRSVECSHRLVECWWWPGWCSWWTSVLSAYHQQMMRNSWLPGDPENCQLNCTEILKKSLDLTPDENMTVVQVTAVKHWVWRSVWPWFAEIKICWCRHRQVSLIALAQLHAAQAVRKALCRKETPGRFYLEIKNVHT